MATVSEVKSGLQAVSDKIAAVRQRTRNAVDTITGSQATLAGIQSAHGAIITEINGYAPTGAFQTLAKDELAKLTAEFQTLKTQVDAAVTALAGFTEF